MTTLLRVLIIEDSEDDMLLQLRELRRGGYEPTWLRVQTSAELQAALQQGDWELILSDYALPGFNGLEALQVVQASGLDIPFILISGTVGEETAVQSMRAGAHDYLLKNSLMRLVPAVRRSLSDAAERRRRRQAEIELLHSRSLLELIQDHTEMMFVLFAHPGQESGARSQESGVRSQESASSLTPDSRLLTPDSRLLTPDSRLLTPDSRLLTPDPQDHRVVLVNRAWLDFAGKLDRPRLVEDWMGLTLEQTLARLACSREQMKKIQDCFRDAATCSQRVTFDQALSVGASGSMFFTEQQFIPVCDGQGGSRHLLWASLDVTQRKHAEDQQRRLEAQLAQAQKLEALGTMASGIAHDFNNILAGISGYAELVRDDPHLPPDVQESMQQILQGIHRATDLARRILAFSRKRTIQRRPMHLGPVIHEALAFMRPLIPPGVVVQANVPAESPLVLADAGQMHQVLINLCTNAVQAMTIQESAVSRSCGPGERSMMTGTLTVAIETVSLSTAFAEKHALRSGGHVRLMVSDTGCGMDQTTLGRLFEPFFTTKPTGVGTGLGLAVVQGIVKNHQGAITVRSTLGQGTSFELYFPLAVEAVPAAGMLGGNVCPGQGERILFVDDEEYLTTMGAALLARLGYRASVFTDPEQAFAAFAAEPSGFDALVTDLSMPGLKGTELASRMRQLRPDLPIVLTTGYCGPHDLDRARALGFHRWLEKPFTAEKLSNVLYLALGRDVLGEGKR